MKIYSYFEIQEIMQKGRSLTIEEGERVLDEFKIHQSYIYQAIFGIYCQEISKINEKMGDLFLDLSFDIIWFFTSVFEKLPELNSELSNEYMKSIDVELKSLTNQVPMDQEFRTFLSDRFIKTAMNDSFQVNLVAYLYEEVEKYVLFDKKRKLAQDFTNNLLFVVVRYLTKVANLCVAD